MMIISLSLLGVMILMAAVKAYLFWYIDELNIFGRGRGRRRQGKRRRKGMPSNKKSHIKSARRISETDTGSNIGNFLIPEQEKRDRYLRSAMVKWHLAYSQPQQDDDCANDEGESPNSDSQSPISDTSSPSQEHSQSNLEFRTNGQNSNENATYQKKVMSKRSTKHLDNQSLSDTIYMLPNGSGNNSCSNHFVDGKFSNASISGLLTDVATYKIVKHNNQTLEQNETVKPSFSCPEFVPENQGSKTLNNDYTNCTGKSTTNANPTSQCIVEIKTVTVNPGPNKKICFVDIDSVSKGELHCSSSYTGNIKDMVQSDVASNWCADSTSTCSLYRTMPSKLSESIVCAEECRNKFSEAYNATVDSTFDHSLKNKSNLHRFGDNADYNGHDTYKANYVNSFCHNVKGVNDSMIGSFHKSTKGSFTYNNIECDGAAGARTVPYFNKYGLHRPSNDHFICIDEAFVQKKVNYEHVCKLSQVRASKRATRHHLDANDLNALKSDHRNLRDRKRVAANTFECKLHGKKICKIEDIRKLNSRSPNEIGKDSN